ncbi:MAG: glycosyltransferase [Anaerolineaceae bacterium]
MKIIVATIGSRGDVQPYINLCLGLQKAGHQVTLATNPTLCPLAAGYGINARPVGPAVDMGAEGARLMANSFGNMWIGMMRVMQLAGRLVQEAYPDVLEVCRGADLVITSDTGSGVVEADRLGIPWASVTLQPGRIPDSNANPSLLTRLIWNGMGRLFVAPTNRFRRRVGAPPLPDLSSVMSKRLILCPVSRHVSPSIAGWPPYARQTGYWFSQNAPDFKPPADLKAFLDAGEPPIAVSLGVMSMSGRQARQGAGIILEAVRRCNVRAVIQGWHAALAGVELPKNIFHAGSLPHNWLFSRASLVIHHGGFGTTAEGLRQGKPTVIIPHAIDQFFWGQKSHELGCSPNFIPRGRLTAANLSSAIMEGLSSQAIIDHAAEVGRAIRAEGDGVAEAVKIIEGTSH